VPALLVVLVLVVLVAEEDIARPQEVETLRQLRRLKVGTVERVLLLHIMGEVVVAVPALLVVLVLVGVLHLPELAVMAVVDFLQT